MIPNISVKPCGLAIMWSPSQEPLQKWRLTTEIPKKRVGMDFASVQTGPKFGDWLSPHGSWLQSAHSPSKACADYIWKIPENLSSRKSTWFHIWTGKILHRWVRESSLMQWVKSRSPAFENITTLWRLAMSQELWAKKNGWLRTGFPRSPRILIFPLIYYIYVNH